MHKIHKAFRTIFWRWGWKAFLIVAIGALFLAGCEPLEVLILSGLRQEREVTFYKGEEWECSVRVIVPPEAMETGLIEEVFESEIRAYLQEKAPDVKASWRKEQEGQKMVYYATFEGKGWAKLNELAFNGNASITRRKGMVRIIYPISHLEAMLTRSLMLKGGKIVYSNADKVTDGNAIWYHPAGTVEAVLTEKGRFNWLLVFLVLLGISLAGGVVFLMLKRRLYAPNVGQ
jgi:hypothetical protein